MKPLFKEFWNDLVNDAAFAKRLIRAVLIGAGTASASVGMLLPNVYAKVTVITLGILAGTVGGLIAAGQMNPGDPKAP